MGATRPCRTGRDLLRPLKGEAGQGKAAFGLGLPTGMVRHGAKAIPALVGWGLADDFSPNLAVSTSG